MSAKQERRDDRVYQKHLAKTTISKSAQRMFVAAVLGTVMTAANSHTHGRITDIDDDLVEQIEAGGTKLGFSRSPFKPQVNRKAPLVTEFIEVSSDFSGFEPDSDLPAPTRYTAAGRPVWSFSADGESVEAVSSQAPEGEEALEEATLRSEVEEMFAAHQPDALGGRPVKNRYEALKAGIFEDLPAAGPLFS